MRRDKSLITGLIFLAVLTLSLGAGASFQDGPGRSEPVGRIAGRVRVEGPYKNPPPLKVNKNRDDCGAEVPDESLLVDPRGGLQNAVIVVYPVPQKAAYVGAGMNIPKVPEAQRYIASDIKPWYGVYGSGNQAVKGQPRTAVLDNRKCAFVPRVQVATVGSEIWLLNSDPILHDAHARLGAETLFNVGLPAWRRVKERLDREGTVRVECEVLHTWQSAYIVVTSSPYFAVTDRSGEFAIAGVPPGAYRVEVWHERLGGASKAVTVRAGTAVRFDFTYRSDWKQGRTPGQALENAEPS